MAAKLFIVNTQLLAISQEREKQTIKKQKSSKKLINKRTFSQEAHEGLINERSLTQ
jgi:hypothetical protein